MATQPNIQGPFWIRTATNGKHQVCGRHGATIREYMPDQLGMASADCRKLQAGFAKAENALRDAAPDLLEALRAIANVQQFSRLDAAENAQWMEDRARAAIAKVSAA